MILLFIKQNVMKYCGLEKKKIYMLALAKLSHIK